MYKLLAMLFSVIIGSLFVFGEELDLKMPFKKGTKSPVAWWNATNAKLIDENGKVFVYLSPGTGMSFKEKFHVKAGDIVCFEVTMKGDQGPVSVRLGQWGKEGFCGEVWKDIENISNDLTVYKAEVVVTDPIKPDRNGNMRNVNEVFLTVFVHSPSKNIMIENVKVFINRKEKK